MITHPSLSILIISKEVPPALHPLLAYFRRIPSLALSIAPELPQDLSPFQVIVAADSENLGDPSDRIMRYVRMGGGWLGLINFADGPLPEVFGAQPTPAGPVTELRVVFQNRNHLLARRLPDPIYLNGRYRGLVLTADDTETILSADWRYRHIPVLTKRPVGNGYIACTTLSVYGDPILQQLLFRLLQELAGRPIRDQWLGVGLLGYSPHIGQKHGLGVVATPGLQLRGLCDINPERLDQANEDFPGVRTYTSAEALARSADIDLVIIGTPPNTHARLSLAMMAAGKHVLCEKPLALNKKEAATMVEAASREKLHLSCCQNRRWDVDYLAIKQAIAEGMIGDLFYLETFVGGFSHPCGFWHSHDEISGGTSYDWGGHFLDWVVSLISDRVESVIGTRHKRVWYDITNADQERIQIRFSGGQEAEFIHSDICAFRKPKWYLLGTEGAIIGQWREVTCYQPDPVLYFRGHDIPATEMLPELTLHRRHPSGQVVAQQLATPKPREYSLYRNLTDHLLTGEPIEAPVEQSALVVAILEAAARSADRGGSVEVLDG
jgi:scyllo-inositol 2-dehydrogenase (NADP+)